MASAIFRIGYASSLSGPWTWGAFGASVDVPASSYIKTELQSTSGVKTVEVWVSSGDETTIAGGLPAVTVDQPSKTATFHVPATVGSTCLAYVRVNQTDSPATRIGLAVHVLTLNGGKLIAVGETTEAGATGGYYAGKMNAAIRRSYAGDIGDPGGGGVNDVLGLTATSPRTFGMITLAGATFASPALGESVKIGAALCVYTAPASIPECFNADQTSDAKHRVIGLAKTAAGSGTVQVANTGEITCTDDSIWDTAHPDAIDAGKAFFASQTTPGNLTLDPTPVPNTWRQPLGTVSYASDAGGATRVSISIVEPEFIVSLPA